MIATTTAPAVLAWRAVQGFEPRYELRDGEELLATLAFDSPTTTRAVAQSAEGTWAFERREHPSALVRVREEGADRDLAEFHPGLLAPGHLRFPGGPDFRWRHEGLGSRAWSFRGGQGEVLLRFRLERETTGGSGPSGPRGAVEVTAAGRFAQRVPLLAALGWYLLLLHECDRAAGDAGGLQGL